MLEHSTTDVVKDCIFPPQDLAKDWYLVKSDSAHLSPPSYVDFQAKPHEKQQEDADEPPVNVPESPVPSGSNEYIP